MKIVPPPEVAQADVTSLDTLQYAQVEELLAAQDSPYPSQTPAQWYPLMNSPAFTDAYTVPP